MKKFLLKSAGFVSFFIAFFILINAIYVAVLIVASFNVENRLESLQFVNPDYNLLVLGASTTSDGVDTELLSENGFKSYNLAIGGSTVRTSYIQLEEYIERYAIKPKYVFLGVNSTMEGDLDKGGIHPIIEVTMKDHNFSIEDIPISKFRWLAFEISKRLVSKDHRNTSLVQGQLRIQRTVKDISAYKEQYLDLQIFESSIWLGEIARLCTQNEIGLFIIEMPGYRETQNLSEFGPYEITLENGYTANVYNFNSRYIADEFDSDHDWLGNSHLNQRGAVKFTDMLIDALQEYMNCQI